MLIASAVLGASVVNAETASAVIPRRNTDIIVAGSTIDGDLGCTVGVVLKKTGFFWNVRPYNAATRFIVTAGHCTHVGQTIYSGTGNVIGTTISVNHQDDLALIRVIPITTPTCHWITGPSGGRMCIPTATYAPRARGAVFMNGPQIPMVGPGTPATGSQLCINGVMTGTNCSFVAVPLPPLWVDYFPGREAGYTDASNAVDGDSGSPVTDAHGTFYGVLTGTGKPGGPLARMMAYNPAAQVFRDFPGYALA
ncbi:S1 family peptidase [Curtobacterium flaccumfaciens]|uniref:S1 family peptidase n=1 Tax=Curtobacterium flaccumfaciens TaxID=2035 RepID=UPI001E4FEC92|nr:S1 family peptidase [Curtobacterium allii]MCE0459773.1 S1 family peptidase [Curtobacterium allii]